MEVTVRGGTGGWRDLASAWPFGHATTACKPDESCILSTHYYLLAYSLVSIAPPAPSLFFFSACSPIAFKNCSTPNPASSGRPKPCTSPPSRPVLSARSRERTPSWNWDELITAVMSASVGSDAERGRSVGR